MFKRFHSLLHFLLLASLWGPSFLFIKITIVEIPPLTLVTLRIGLSALLLLAILIYKRKTIPLDLKLWKHCFFMGIVASSLPFILFSLSLEHIDSILSSLINGTTPMTTVLLAHFFLQDEKFNLNRVLGIGLGFSGFLILFLPSILNNDISGDSFGMLCSLGASFCYAIGMVYARKNIVPPKEPLMLPTLQLLTSLIYLIPLAILIDPPFYPTEISFTSWASMSFLAFLGTSLAFIVYYKIVMKYGATTLSTVTYVLPLFSIILGVIFLDEKVNLQFALATLLILLGTMVTNGFLPLKSFRLPIIKYKKSPSSTQG